MKQNKEIQDLNLLLEYITNIYIVRKMNLFFCKIFINIKNKLIKLENNNNNFLH